VEKYVEPGRPQMTIWCIHIACWIPKATNVHSEFVILIAFPLKQWLHERDNTFYLCTILAFHWDYLISLEARCRK